MYYDTGSLGGEEVWQKILYTFNRARRCQECTCLYNRPYDIISDC